MKKSILAMSTVAVMTSSVAMAEGPRIAGGKAEEYIFVMHQILPVPCAMTIHIQKQMRL